MSSSDTAEVSEDARRTAAQLTAHRDDLALDDAHVVRHVMSKPLCAGGGVSVGEAQELLEVGVRSGIDETRADSLLQFSARDPEQLAAVGRIEGSQAALDQGGVVEGRHAKTTDPAYDSVRQVTSTTAGAGNTTAYDHEKRDRVVTSTFGVSEVVCSAYCDKGLLRRTIDGSSIKNPRIDCEFDN